MKRLALFAIVVYIGSSTVVNTDGDNYFAIIPKTCTDEGVGVSTTPVACVQTPPMVSTGPYIFKAKGSGDCFTEPFMYDNGTFPTNPADYIACPQ